MNFLHMSIAKTATKTTDTATGTTIMTAGIMTSTLCDEYDWLVIAAVTVTSSSFCVECDTLVIAAVIAISVVCTEVDISTSK